MRSPAIIISGSIIAFLTLVSVIAPHTGLFNSDAIDPNKILAGPDWRHPFGYDALGRDVVSRLLPAYSTSLGIALASVALALLVGGTLGGLAGYFRGWADLAAMRPVDMLLAFPALLLAVLCISIIGRGSITVIVAVAVIYSPLFARVSRSSTLAVSSAPFVDAARCRGSSTRWILLRHVIPNALGPTLVLASVLAAFAVQIQAALAFLGLGAQPPTPSLGGMLADGNQYLTQAPYLEVFPGLSIVVTVAAFLVLGEGLRRRLDPHHLAA